MKKQDELLDHNYDGIQEYDNDLPKWWVYLFWITIIWSVGYVFWFHSPSTPTPEERLAAGLQELEQMRPKQTGGDAVAGDSDESLLKLVSNAEMISKGLEIYTGKCLACHAQGGAGLVGPNLADNYWIHGGKPTQIKKVIVEGVPEKGMISWKAMMSDQEINAVVAYIWSLHGTTPPNAKAPQGELFTR
jgi:cytochrome c oxidase cbb3-type subunit 3